MSGPVPLVTPQTVVTAIGTQRILAPLRLISRRTEVRLRTGGFCCSDQSTRLARTRIERLVAREKRIGVASGAPVFIEISSRKTLSLNGRPVGRSFLERRFPDAMQNASLARQILTIAELTGREKRIEALTNRASLYHVLTPADLRELAGYTLETAKEQDMAADLSAIAGLVPSPIIVTPIGADLIDGGLVDESGALKSMLMRCLLQLDIPAFDPTSLVSSSACAIRPPISPSMRADSTVVSRRCSIVRPCAETICLLSPAT